MNKPLGVVLALAFTSVTALSADAATHAKGGHEGCEEMAMHHGMHGDMAATMQKKLDELHSKLKLSKDQEPAWKTFSDQVSAQGKKMSDMRANMPSQMQKNMGQNAPERMEMMAGMMKDRAQDMAAMAEAMKTFYATLTPEQKATFDSVHKEHMRHMGGMGGMGHADKSDRQERGPKK